MLPDPMNHSMPVASGVGPLNTDEYELSRPHKPPDIDMFCSIWIKTGLPCACAELSSRVPVRDFHDGRRHNNMTQFCVVGKATSSSSDCRALRVTRDPLVAIKSFFQQNAVMFRHILRRLCAMLPL